MMCLAGKTNIKYVILAVKEGPGSPELPKKKIRVKKTVCPFCWLIKPTINMFFCF